MKFREVFDEDWVNVPNALSALRPLLIPIFLYCSIEYVERPSDLSLLYALIAIIFTASFTDFLDGFIARRLNIETRMGRYLDPISDKLVSLSSLVILTAYYGFPVWIFLYYVLREILGVWLGTYLYFRRDMQGRPNMWGKVGVFTVALVALWYVCRPYLATRFPATNPLVHPEYGAYVLVVVMAIGMLVYAHTYRAPVFGEDGNT